MNSTCFTNDQGREFSWGITDHSFEIHRRCYGACFLIDHPQGFNIALLVAFKILAYSAARRCQRRRIKKCPEAIGDAGEFIGTLIKICEDPRAVFFRAVYNSS